MTVLETVAESLGEKVDSTNFEALCRPLPLEPRCRVCRNDTLRAKVNHLLSVGTGYAMILRATEDDNARLDKRDRITIDSVRNHCARHFAVQNIARATYREILERRAKENGIDFINGVATAITPLAFLETVMIKSYESLVDSDTEVDVTTGMIAAGRLQAMLDFRANGANMATVLAEVGQIIDAVKSTVPESMWGEIARKLNGSVEGIQPPVDEDSDVFDPDDDSFEDDELGQFMN